MEYISLTKKTLATTIAALAIATTSGCMGVGKAFTTFGKQEGTIERREDDRNDDNRKDDNHKDDNRKDDNRSNEQESAPYTPPVKQDLHEKKQDLEHKQDPQDKQDDQKNEPRRNIRPEFKIRAETCDYQSQHISYTKRS
jgi:hypothetical protein